MNILFERFPDRVTVDGEDYRIVTDFREYIKLHEFLMQTKRFTRYDLDLILEWYIDRQPANEREAVIALTDFMSADEIQTGEIYDTDEEQGNRAAAKAAFSFRQDAACIFSAFFQCYGIDLEQIPYMHWWKFLILFEGLPSTTEIKARIYYRTVDLNTIKDKEERKRIKEIRRHITIKEPQERKMDAYEIGDVFG